MALLGCLTSFVVVGFDRLFESGDVPEGEQEQDDQVSFVLDRGNLK